MKNLTLILVIFLFLCSCESPQKQATTTSALELKVDSLVQRYLDSAKIAGVAIAVMKDNQPLLLNSYGYADLAFDTKMPVNATFEIGSVTKQFTGAAIMQLVEQGKLSLDDDMTKYVAFDTKGRKVTVRQLLSHTSGIKGYTELQVFGKLAMEKHKRDTLLRVVEKESFDFEPGEALIYNNTGFFILGLIIEKVTGQSYEEYVTKNLFEKAGMSNSYYASERTIMKNKAHGYEMGEKGLVIASYLDHTWPYAAGSLGSSVEDLVKWNDALHNGKILSEVGYREFITPVTLNDGTVTQYAKGITVTESHGRTMLEHGGGIFGYLSENMYYPQDKLSIVVLVNTAGPVGPTEIANHIAGWIFGKQESNSTAFSGDVKKFAGVFKGRGRGRDMVVTIENNNNLLVAKYTEGKPDTLKYVKDNTWTDGNGTYIFSGTDNLNELRIDQVYGYYSLKKQN
jgi:CubicO group peptidase (beta-lactamase class C family)